MASAGCVLHVNRDLAPPPGFTYTPNAPGDPAFADDPTQRDPPEVRLSAPMDSTRTHDVVRLEYESSGHNGHPQNLVEGLYLRSRDPGPKKLVVVMPIWGTSTYPPDKISHGYARHAGKDANVIWIYGTAPLFPWATLRGAKTEAEFMAMGRDSAERYRSAVVDMRRLIDWAATQPDIDSTRIAFVGFSMSALVTATLLGNEPRIDAAVLMMGAAHYADVFAHCGDRVAEVRDHTMKAFGWSLEQYRNFFAGLFDRADPTMYPGHYDPEKILMIDTMFDDCMPESARAALWEVTGRPERITLLYHHRTAFYSLTPLGLNFTRRKIYRFLDEALETGTPSAAAR
jgi:pimeloyl-ACP methyl ester carboxylesterase